MGSHGVLLDLPPPLGVHGVTPTPQEKAEGWGETGTVCPRVGCDWRSVLREVAVRNLLGFLLSSLVLNEVCEN